MTPTGEKYPQDGVMRKIVPPEQSAFFATRRAQQL